MRRYAAVLLLAASACSSGTNPQTLSVVSQNLYLGGDIFLVTVAADATEAAAATYDVWQTVQATNFPARAKVIAAGIAAQNPDVIGLQEVTTWRTGVPAVCAPDGSGLPVINAPIAGTVVYDFLGSLQAELAALGLQYDVAAVTQANDIEFCAFKATSGEAPIDVRYTDRDVILVRSGMPQRNASGGVYDTYIPVPIPGTPVVVPQRRAWNVVEVQKGSTWVRVFETHLEVQEIAQAEPYGFIFQLAQAGELIGLHVNPANAAAPLPTVLVGDMNSQAEQPGGSPLRITYNFLAQGLPFPDVAVVPWWPSALVGTVSPLADAWTQANPGQPGLTWGFSDDLLTGTMSQRIDLILAWDAGGQSMQTFGATAMTATTPPLHASDHLGVAAQIALP
ncbi:MAG TPA: endonuclease/exonuclease/phosphatase family protein [Anaeromyxobacteraceae bacterium]|nr:endonuclease/exonuclease/phosphatase family protein [Anaeromyxobacteraceae bacterium]